MGVWGGLAGLGGTLGVVAGGVLVDALGWQWVFFVNVPIVIALIVATPLFVRESRAHRRPRALRRRPARVLGTGGLLALVLRRDPRRAARLGRRRGPRLLAGAVALLAAFVVGRVALGRPARAAAAVPLARPAVPSSVALALNGAAFLAMFFLTAIFLQQVRGDSALDAGLHFLPMGFAAIAGAAVASSWSTRLGTRPVHIGGAA